MTPGERIKEVRIKIGMSQVDFANKINVSKQTLYKYENNIVVNIPHNKIEAAARIGGVSPTYLMGWETNTNSDFGCAALPQYTQNLMEISAFGGEVNPMTQGERIRAIRQELGLTLEKFGEKLGVGRGAISAIEVGRRNLTDQMAKAICREYNVNYDFLVYGDGEMFDDLPETILDELCAQYNMDELDRSIVASYLQLSDVQRAAIKQYVQNLIDSNKKKAGSEPDTEELEAAHDDGATAEQKKHADDIMHDPSEWE